jgi:hypothetical protein
MATRDYAAVDRESIAGDDGSDSDTELSAALGAPDAKPRGAPRPPGMG